jgi:hypothetical protein
MFYKMLLFHTISYHIDIRQVFMSWILHETFNLNVYNVFQVHLDILNVHMMLLNTPSWSHLNSLARKHLLLSGFLLLVSILNFNVPFDKYNTTNPLMFYNFNISVLNQALHIVYFYGPKDIELLLSVHRTFVCRLAKQWNLETSVCVL